MTVKKKIKRSKSSAMRIDDMEFVVDSLDLPIVAIDHQQRIRRFNKSWSDLFVPKNKDPKSYFNKNYFEFLSEVEQMNFYPSEVRIKIEQIIRKVYESDIRPKFLEFATGKHWFLSHIHPVCSGEKFEGIIVTLHDITTWKEKQLLLQKKTKESLESSERKMFFLANLSHELKSPLNSILGFSNLLREYGQKDEHLDGYVGLIENIIEGAHHLKSIVFRILNMAKIESGTLTLNEERVMPVKLVQLSLNIVKPMFPDRIVKAEIRGRAGAETIKCDKNLAMEVLINLLVNALKFSKDDVFIYCYLDEKENLIFEVKDSGIGMTEEEIHVALEPFGQNLRSPDDKNTGLGLGVPFSNQIMKLHSGDLNISSEKGKGTTVKVVFPAQRVVI